MFAMCRAKRWHEKKVARSLPAAGWDAEIVQIPQAAVPMTQTVTGMKAIFSGTGSVTVHRST